MPAYLGGSLLEPTRELLPSEHPQEGMLYSGVYRSAYKSVKRLQSPTPRLSSKPRPLSLAPPPGAAYGTGAVQSLHYTFALCGGIRVEEEKGLRDSAKNGASSMSLSYAARGTYLSIYLLTILTGFPTNLLVLCALIQKLKTKATPNCVLLLNLTLSDIFFLAFLPFKVAEVTADHWPLPTFLCPLSGLVYFSTIYSSTLFLTAVSVERYLGVAYPIHYKMRRNSAYAVIASLGLWVCSFAHCSIVYITEFQRDNYSSPSDQSDDICYDNFTQAQLTTLLPVRLELGIVLFLVPSLITCFCYFGFMRIVMSSPHIHKSKKHRAVGLVAATLAVFIICFAPYNVSHVVGFINWESPKWRNTALLLSTFNACLDPIIFYFSSSAVQHSCWGFLTRVERTCALPSLIRKLFCRGTEKLGRAGSPELVYCSKL
ncbi:free fatty acid receptor 3-like [Elgaria multicarinata webbii]|uniref:free fatty acid receptor 3-like n=1 Tax=Elgaria multicarinata webbii TaxID=159646 RepID=UPI002FCD5A0B